MESAKRGSSGESARPDGQRRRPQPPVLDLTATEVPAAPAAATGQSAEAESAVVGETGTQAGAEPPQDRGDPSISPQPATPAASEAPQADMPGAAAAPASALADHDRRPATAADGAALSAEDQHPGAETAAAESSPARGAIAPEKPTPPRRGSTIAMATVAGAAAGALAALGILWAVDRGSDRDSRAAADAARVGRLETQLRELAARPPATPTVASELGPRIAAGEEALQNVKALEARLAQAEATLRTPPAGADPELGKRIAALDAGAQQLDQSVGALRRRLDEISANAQAARDTAMASAGSSTAVAANAASEVESLTKRVQALETAAQTLQAAISKATAPEPDTAARLASVALALRVAVERGEPFAAELAALQKLVRDPARLAPLQPFAAAGVPSAEALARELSALIADQRRGADPVVGDGGGVLERVGQAVTKLVRIRPVDAPTQGPPGDAFANLKAAAARGDVAAALAEVEKLPQAHRAAFAPWAAKAQARTAAMEAARSLAREAVGALGASAAEPVRR